MNHLLIYITLIGIAVWFPGLSRDRTKWLGFRFFLGNMSVIALLFYGNVLLGLKISHLGWGLLAVGVLGIVVRIIAWVRKRADYPHVELLHPVFIFPALLLLVAWWNGGINYFPYPGDETASWLRYARQIYVVDAYWAPELKYHLGGYSNGWPLLIAYSNVLSAKFNDANAIILPFLLHVGLLGFLFDFVRFLLLRTGTCSAGECRLFAWVVLLIMLAAEVSWVLFPEFQLIEKPLLYAFLGAFLLGIAGLYDELDRKTVVIAFGLIVVGGYLIKLSMLAIGPTLGIFWLGFLWTEYKQAAPIGFFRYPFSPEGMRKALSYAAALLLPLFVTMAVWTQHSFGSHCFSSPWAYVTTSESLFSARSKQVVDIILNAVLTYTTAYKFEMTVGAAIVAIVSLREPRCRWVVAGVAVFILFHVVLMHSAYHLCYPPFGETGLQSFQRYFRPNLRLLHFIAPLLLLIVALEWPAFRMALSAGMRNRLARACLVLAATILLIWQAKSISGSLVEITTRANMGPGASRTIQSVKQDAGRLSQIIQDRKLVRPRVSLIAQGGYGVEWDLSRYFGIGDKKGGLVFNYWPEPPYSWAPVRANSFTKITTAEELESWWREFPIIWPIRTDPWTREILAALVDSDECRGAPERYFLFNRGDGRFECVPKGN
jgi:hypothetical protein